MKNLFSMLVVLISTGCATVDRNQYPNVAFDKDASMVKIEFQRSQPPSQSVYIEQCVREHLKNEPIAIGETNKTSVVNLLFGMPMIHPISKKYNVEASELIIESSPNRV